MKKLALILINVIIAQFQQHILMEKYHIILFSHCPQLEFIQSLASPAYLHYLATSGILYQSPFLDFLRYLRYWKEPQYAKYIIYPQCLYFLDLLKPIKNVNNRIKKLITMSCRGISSLRSKSLISVVRVEIKNN